MDLTGFEFATASGAWLPGPERLVHLELDVAQPRSGRHLADAVLGLALVDPAASEAAWFDAVRRGWATASVTDWSTALACAYLATAVAAVAVAAPWRPVVVP